MKFKDPMCKSQLIFHFVLLALLLTATQSGFAADPLSFSNNFFVTGDYIVAGAYNMTSNFTTINGNSYAVGTINVPDKSPGPKGVANPGIQGATSVPKGAQIVAALLYWQTVEKVGVAPGAPGSGQNGYFRPVVNGGPAAPGYAISGTNVSGSTTVSWSSGGCGGSSTGKLLRTYRADVAGGLPVDANGNSMANASFEVRLPSVGNATPLTLGATLVVIYRIPNGVGGPNVPLNAIVIYDGDYSQSNSQLTMTQPLHGFYDAAASPVSRLTHIVGSGQSNKFQTVYLQSGANSFVALPALYGNKLPAFPGWYGTWDNTTWLLTNPSKTSPGILEDASSAATQVVPSMSNQGCVSWGAVITSTTVKNSDNDGILNSWKTADGYCDYLANPSCAGSSDAGWIALPDAHIGEKDIYLHYDYLCSTVTGGTCTPSSTAASLSAVGASSGATATYNGTFSPLVPPGTLVTVSGFTKGVNNGQFFVVSGTSTQLVVNNANAVAETTPATATYGDYSFDPRLAKDPLDNNKDAVQKMIDAFNNHTGSPGTEPFVLHVERGNAIQEQQTSCADTDTDANGNLTCIFPNEPGTVGFREGLAWIKNSTIETNTGMLGCDPSSDINCVGFQHGKKDSYHYALFSHGVGLESWFLSDKSLQSVTQSGTTVTFTTKSPHGLMPIAGDTVCSKANGSIGRVTVLYAITNPNLNYTFCAHPVGNPPAANKFAVTLRNNPLLPGTVLSSYTVGTDPNLSVADGNVTSMSGYSDLGGQNSVISLGEGGWAPVQNFSPPSEGNKWNVKAGTFMHEVGHTLGLTHGGAFLANYKPSAKPPVIDYTPTYEVNCKANVQSVMSYMFQFDLLQAPGPGNEPPIKVLDYSKDTGAVPTLAESTPDGLTGLAYPYTSWFLPSTGPLPSNHCDGSPTVAGENSYLYTNQPVLDFTYTAGQDINFNGSTTDVMHPHDEWEGTPAAGDGSVGLSAGVDLQQVSAAGTVSAIGPGGEAGGLKPSGTGGGLKPAGTGGGLKPAGTGGAGFTPAGGGGGFKPAGTGGASFEISHNQASSYPRPPQNLFINQEEASPRFIDLNWFAASFGTAVQYNIYRAAAGVNGDAFSQIGSIPGSQTSFQNTVPCNLGGYQYRVTAVTNNDAGTQLESSPSNTVPASGDPLLTGCYVVSPVSYTGPAVQGSIVPITWTLTDDLYIALGDVWAHAAPNNPVTNKAANTLVANGPLPGNCTAVGSTAILQAGTPHSGASTFGNSNSGQFTFNWDTDGFCAGSYTFTLTLDSTQSQMTTSPLQLAIDIGDTDSTPHITTLSVPDATVDASYNVPLTEEGGVGAVTWSIASGSAPPNITLSSGGLLAGTPIVPAPGELDWTIPTPYSFTVKVTDSATPTANSGTEAFTLRLITPVSFKATPKDTGLSPLGVIAAHFTNSGNVDLATANSGDGTVSILLGSGDGTFTAQPNLTAGSIPHSLAAGDFNGDGKQDLAVANSGDNTVSVFLGNGDGSFGTGVTYPAGNAPVSVVTGDFNGDGKLDLAVVNQNGATVSILLGDGLGAFSQPNPPYPAGTTDAAYVATGDFDGDGNLDLAVTNPSNDTVSVLLGNGNGTFKAAVPYATGNPGNHPIAVSAVDFNGDGKLDLAVTNLDANNVAILLNNGYGAFPTRVTYPTTNGTLFGPAAMTTGDFNGDGKVDLAITEQSNNRVSILLGNGDATFQSPLEFTTGNFASGVAAGDFNGDGRLDLAVANHGDNTVSVMLHLPQPPTNLAATNVTSTAATLGWTASTSTVAMYNVYRSTTPGGPYTPGTLLTSLPATTITYTDNTVSHGTTYYYVVTAVGVGSLESVNSNEVFAAP